MCLFVLMFICSSVHVFNSSHVHVFMCSCVHLFSRSHVHVFICLGVHVFNCSYLLKLVFFYFLNLFWCYGAGISPRDRLSYVQVFV